jgi:hypothetical protein
MAPSVDANIISPTDSSEQGQTLKTTKNAIHKEPLKASGSLSSNYFDLTSIIGREYPDVQISALMNSPRREEYIRDLAITGMCEDVTNTVSRILGFC